MESDRYRVRHGQPCKLRIYARVGDVPLLEVVLPKEKALAEAEFLNAKELKEITSSRYGYHGDALLQYSYAKVFGALVKKPAVPAEFEEFEVRE